MKKELYLYAFVVFAWIFPLSAMGSLVSMPAVSVNGFCQAGGSFSSMENSTLPACFEVGGPALTMGSISFSPSPIVAANAVSLRTSPLISEQTYSSSSFSLLYAFAIIGKQGRVPLHIFSQGVVQYFLEMAPFTEVLNPLFLGAYARGHVSVSGDGLYLNNNIEISNEFGLRSEEFRVDETYSVETNSVYWVDMASEVFLSARDVGVASMYALMDPYFSLDMLPDEASEYSIIFSDGVGNSPFQVPEPSLLLLAMLGLIALVFQKVMFIFARNLATNRGCSSGPCPWLCREWRFGLPVRSS